MAGSLGPPFPGPHPLEVGIGTPHPARPQDTPPPTHIPGRPRAAHPSEHCSNGYAALTRSWLGPRLPQSPLGGLPRSAPSPQPSGASGGESGFEPPEPRASVGLPASWGPFLGVQPVPWRGRTPSCARTAAQRPPPAGGVLPTLTHSCAYARTPAHTQGLWEGAAQVADWWWSGAARAPRAAWGSARSEQIRGTRGKWPWPHSGSSSCERGHIVSPSA